MLLSRDGCCFGVDGSEPGRWLVREIRACAESFCSTQGVRSDRGRATHAHPARRLAADSAHPRPGGAPLVRPPAPRGTLCARSPHQSQSSYVATLPALLHHSTTL